MSVQDILVKKKKKYVKEMRIPTEQASASCATKDQVDKSGILTNKKHKRRENEAVTTYDNLEMPTKKKKKHKKVKENTEYKRLDVMNDHSNSIDIPTKVKMKGMGKRKYATNAAYDYVQYPDISTKKMRTKEGDTKEESVVPPIYSIQHNTIFPNDGNVSSTLTLENKVKKNRFKRIEKKIESNEELNATRTDFQCDANSSSMAKKRKKAKDKKREDRIFKQNLATDLINDENITKTSGPDNSRTNKKISKIVSKRHDNIFEDLSPIYRAPDTSAKKLSKKRKQDVYDSNCSMLFTEEALHKSSKMTSKRDDSNTQESTNEIIVKKPVAASGKNFPLEDIFSKLIKNRMEENDKIEKQQAIQNVLQISAEIEDTFSKKRTNRVAVADRAKQTKSKNKKATEANKQKIDQNNIVCKENNSDNEMDELSNLRGRKVKIENKKNGYINGIKLSTLQLQSLEGLIVRLPFDPHPVHMIETKLTNRPKKEQREQMEALGYALLTRCYSSFEDNVIKNNWKEFCERHTLDEDPSPFLVPNIYFPHMERTKFVRYLARGLEHRTLASVQKRFRLLSNTELKKGRFTEEEDRIIFEYIEKIEQEGYTKKDVKVFAHLATLLKRDRLQIEKHYILLCKEKKSKLNSKDCDKMIRTLLEVLGKEQLDELENCEITLTDWKNVEKLMNHPYNLLKSFWRHTLYPKLFYEGDRRFYSICKDITRILLEKEEDDWRVVEWELIAKEFKGHTAPALFKLYKNLVYSKVPKPKWDDLHACITHLMDNYFKENETNRTGHLKRISQDDNGVYKIYKDYESHYRSIVV